MRTMVICRRCGYTGSVESGQGAAPTCPNCKNVQLFYTGYDRDTYHSLSDEEKAALKEKWMTEIPMTTSSSASSAHQEDYLRQIAENTASIKFWVKFWSILSLVGYAFIIISLLNL